LPQLLSFRKAIRATGKTARLAAAVDEFVSVVTFTNDDLPLFERMQQCKPLMFQRSVGKEDELVILSDSIMHLSLIVQNISDAVTDLLASSTQSR
jgi:hypothetical protein